MPDELFAKDYQPRSELVVPEHHVPRARFPVIDAHNHVSYSGFGWERQDMEQTLRNAPADADTANHQLMLRAGLVQQLAAGIYSYLPTGWKVMRKIEQIVREEMDRAGGQEVIMPVVQPAELWEESGRIETMGDVLFHLKDRRERELILGPTHEEVVVDLGYSVPWTSDRITPAGREALRSAGFAPPQQIGRSFIGDTLTVLPTVTCPYCASRNTTLENPFGPTLCRAIYHCADCRQPFEAFKQV